VYCYNLFIVSMLIDSWIRIVYFGPLNFLIVGENSGRNKKTPIETIGVRNL